MGKIFKKASCVFAWLGHDTGRPSHSYESGEISRIYADQPGIIEYHVREVAGTSLQSAQRGVYGTTVLPDWRYNVQLTWSQLFLDDTNDPALGFWRDDVFHSLVSLCGSELWFRVWMRQELWLARDIVLCQGTHSVAWSDFQLAFKNIDTHTPKLNRFNNFHREAFSIPHSTASEVTRLRATFREKIVHDQSYSGLAPLRTLLEACAGLESTVLHDRVYGLLGMASDGHKIPVDYTKNPAELYLDVLKAQDELEMPIELSRMLLRDLELFDDSGYKALCRSLEKWSKEGKQCHIKCSASCWSYVLDASYTWTQAVGMVDGIVPKGLLYAGQEVPLTGTHPAAWLTSWKKQHGPDARLRLLSDISGDSETASTLFAASRTDYLDWTFEAKRLNLLMHEKLDETDGYSNTLAEVLKLSNVTSGQPEKAANTCRPGRARSGPYTDRYRVILGARGEAGIASEGTQPCDLIVAVGSSFGHTDQPVFLLARRVGDYFKVVGRAFLRLQKEGSGGDGDDDWITSSLADFDPVERLGPPETLHLWMDVRTLYHLSMVDE